MDPLTTMLAVAGCILLRDLLGYLIGRLTGSAPPPPPPPPGVPSVTPTAGSHPLLNWVLGTLYAAQGVKPPADATHAPAGLLQQLVAEAQHALAAQAPATPAAK